MLATLCQRNIQRDGRRLGIGKEHFVKVTHPVKEQRIRVTALDLQILRHHRRDCAVARAQILPPGFRRRPYKTDTAGKSAKSASTQAVCNVILATGSNSEATLAIYNFGSINIDHFYRVPHFPAPGETLAAENYVVGLGGKGANQSAAAAKAGATTYHIGGIGPESDWIVKRLAEWGVKTRHIARIEMATGHAIINVDKTGENTIVLFAGANRAMPFSLIESALAEAMAGDTLLLQNETAHQAEAAQLARTLGLHITYSAAPFDVSAVRAILPHITLLALNAVEADQLCRALNTTLDSLDVPEILVTRGAEGAEWRDRTGQRAYANAHKVTAVDTTGAGDTFLGYFAAGRDMGLTPAAALTRAGAAASLKVTRPGTADAIPRAAEVDSFLAQ
jgi:ribokinase